MRLVGNVEGLVIDALYVPESAEQLIRLIAGKSVMTSRGAEIAGTLIKPHQRRQALFLARNGIGRSPANRDGRLLLAQLLIEAGRSDLARRILIEGLAFHHEDPAYLRPLFSFLFQCQGDASVPTYPYTM